MSKIVMIFTGGTISMKINEGDQSVVPAFSANEIMMNLFNSELYQDLETIEYAEVPSPSITPSMMLDIAKIVKRELLREDVFGAVVVHGTDTLEETAFFLDVVVDTDKPVVVTGSMKSSSELGFDGINNLVSSILVAKSTKSLSKGVLVVMNDQINAASEVTKSNTLSLDTFKSMDFGPLGVVDNKEVIYHRRVNYQKKRLTLDTFEPNVHLLKVYAGMDSALIDFLVDGLHTKGIVLEAMGRGNVPPQMVDSIKRAISFNIPVVITSRCPSGRVLNTYGYPGGGKDLANIGCIFAPNLNGQKARILLMIGLAQSNERAFLKKIFE
jgi:L-asparaginase